MHIMYILLYTIARATKGHFGTFSRWWWQNARARPWRSRTKFDDYFCAYVIWVYGIKWLMWRRRRGARHMYVCVCVWCEDCAAAVYNRLQYINRVQGCFRRVRLAGSAIWVSDVIGFLVKLYSLRLGVFRWYYYWIILYLNWMEHILNAIEHENNSKLLSP